MPWLWWTDSNSFQKTIPQREQLVSIFQRLAKAIKKTQDKNTGVWRHIIDKPNREGNVLDAPASCIFTYALAKGTRKGYLDDSYRWVAGRAYKGIIDQFVSKNPDGMLNLNRISRSAKPGNDNNGSYSDDIKKDNANNDSKGIGPFITASIETYKLYQ